MRICIYGAASRDLAEVYYRETYALAAELAKEGHSLVFGGGSGGMMGSAAEAFHDNGASILAITPTFLNKGDALYPHCDKVIFTDTMKERKALLISESDISLVTPGGIGTYEEFFEVYNLVCLGQIERKIILFNINHYYDDLQKLLNHAEKEHFLREGVLKRITFASTREEVLEAIKK